MKYLIIFAWCLAVVPAHAEALLECSNSFHAIETPDKHYPSRHIDDAGEAAAWMDAMRNMSNKGYVNEYTKCEPLDDTNPSWHLFVQTVNGTITLQGGLTRNTCEQALRLADVRRNADGAWVIQGNDFKQGKCFQ